MRAAYLTLTLAICACGARSDLGSPDGVSDAATDSAPPRDSATGDTSARPDSTPPDAGGSGTCTVGEPFVLTQMLGELSYPALARVDDAAMLIFTRDRGDRSPQIVALPITTSGEMRAASRDIAAGTGGTLLATTISTDEPGFTLSFRNSLGQIAGARFGLDAEAPAVAPLGRPTASVRPLLVLTPELAANGWNPPDPAAVATGFVNGLPSGSYALLDFLGRDPRGARAETDRTFRVATHDGTTGFIETYDVDGALLDELHLTVDPSPFPLSVAGMAVVDDATDAWVLYGGFIRALEESRLFLRLGEHTFTSDAEGDRVLDVGAAYDASSRWLGVATGILHDEGISRGPTPHVFFHGLARDGSRVQSIVAGPLFTSDGAPDTLHPAIMTTGTAPDTFLIVWEHNEGDEGRIGGAIVQCSAV